MYQLLKKSCENAIVRIVGNTPRQGWEVSRYSLGRAWIEAIFWLGIGLGEPFFMYLVY